MWASDCQIESFEEIERELADKKELTTVYFEGNPLQKRGRAVYRNKVRLALPQVRQIDASESRCPFQDMRQLLTFSPSDTAFVRVD